MNFTQYFILLFVLGWSGFLPGRLNAQLLDSTTYWFAPRSTYFPQIMSYSNQNLEIFLTREHGILRCDTAGKAIFKEKLQVKNAEYFPYRGCIKFHDYWIGYHYNKGAMGINSESGDYIDKLSLGVAFENLYGPTFNGLTVYPVLLEGGQIVVPMLWLHQQTMIAGTGKPTALLVSLDGGSGAVPTIKEKPLQIAPEPNDELFNDITDYMQGYYFAPRKGGGFFEAVSIAPVLYEYNSKGTLIKKHELTLPDSVSKQYQKSEVSSIPPKQRRKIANEIPVCLFFGHDTGSGEYLLELSYIPVDTISESMMVEGVCYNNLLIEKMKHRLLVAYNPRTGMTRVRACPAGMATISLTDGYIFYMRVDQDLAAPLVVYREKIGEWLRQPAPR